MYDCQKKEKKRTKGGVCVCVGETLRLRGRMIVIIVEPIYL